MLKCIDACSNLVGFILCCPCISCYAGFYYCYNKAICLDEICKKVFEEDFITSEIIGKKWIIDNNKNWLVISKENKEKLAKKLLNSLYNQLCKYKINIDYILNNYYGKQFLVIQLRWFIQMSIIHTYDNIEKEWWNLNSSTFELVKLEKESFGWNKPTKICKNQGKKFVDKFLYIDTEKINYDINTEKEDEYLTLKFKYYNLIDKILDSDNDYVPLLNKSNLYLKQEKEKTDKNIELANKRIG